MCVCVSGNSTEGRGIPGNWERQEGSRHIYLLGKGIADAGAVQMPHGSIHDPSLWGGLHAAHSLSQQQPRGRAGAVTGQGISGGSLPSPSHSVLHLSEHKARGDRSGDMDGLQGSDPTCKNPFGVIS